jgi:hypothetical protein
LLCHCGNRKAGLLFSLILLGLTGDPVAMTGRKYPSFASHAALSVSADYGDFGVVIRFIAFQRKPGSDQAANAARVARSAAMPRRFSALVKWISGCAARWRLSSAETAVAVSASFVCRSSSVLVSTI